jgi:RimJ/RimL family protein N-acetyltransferase
VGTILQALLLEVPETLDTARLRLTATRAGQGAEINAAVVESHVELAPWMPWAREVQTLEVAETHCREMQAKWHAREMIDFCFHRRGDGGFVGKGGLHTIDWTIPKFEIGYWIRTACTRRGYATEATMALASFAREALGANRIEIAADARNVASRRVAEKSGFTLEGIRLRSRRDNAGALADSCLYARVF